MVCVLSFALALVGHLQGSLDVLGVFSEGSVELVIVDTIPLVDVGDDLVFGR